VDAVMSDDPKKFHFSTHHFMFCHSCKGTGGVMFEVPEGVRVAWTLDEALAMTPLDECEFGERSSRFTPSMNGWPKLPEGLHYSHLCHRPYCGNPTHFCVSPGAVNQAMSLTDYYPCEHPRTPENTYKNGTSTRCRECCLRRNRRRNETSD
jgi:hypothetical protein